MLTTIFDCHSIANLQVRLDEQGVEQRESSLFFSHGDPDHCDVDGLREWGGSIYMSTLTKLVLEYLAANRRDSTLPGSLSKSNNKEFSEGKMIEIPEVCRVIPRPISHGTFAFAFDVETWDREYDIFISPDNGYGRFTKESIDATTQRLVEKGKPLDILIADAKNWGKEQVLVPQEQWKRIKDLIKIAKGGVLEAVPQPCPVVLHMKKGHLIQMLNWYDYGLFDDSDVKIYIRWQMRRLMSALADHLRSKGDPMADRWLLMLKKSNEFSEDDPTIHRKNAVYITDHYLDFRHTEPHLLGACVRTDGEPTRTTETCAYTANLGISGHNYLAYVKMVESFFEPGSNPLVAATHNGSSGRNPKSQYQNWVMGLAARQILKDKGDMYEIGTPVEPSSPEKKVQLSPGTAHFIAQHKRSRRSRLSR